MLLSSRMSASGCRNELTLCTKPSSYAGRIPTLISIGLKCLAVLPVTSAEGERSFIAKLRLLKTFLRATMGEERLVGLALKQCHRQLVALMQCHRQLVRAVPEIILRGWGAANTFCPVGGGCFVDNVSEGWGVGR